jgi:uncharacterized membrane protein
MNDRRGGDVPWHDGMHYAHDSWWNGPLHLLLLLLLIALIVVGVVWLVRRLQVGPAALPVSSTGPAPTAPTSDPAVAALRLRYAQGDVPRDDYLRAMDDLAGTGRWPAEPGEEDTEQTES